MTAIALKATDGSGLAAINDGYQTAFFAAAALLAALAVRIPGPATADDVIEAAQDLA